MNVVVTINVKLDEIEFTLNAAQAKELHKILSQFLGLEKSREDYFQDLKNRLEEIKAKERPPVYVPQPYPVPAPIWPRPYPYWGITWSLSGNPQITAVNENLR